MLGGIRASVKSFEEPVNVRVSKLPIRLLVWIAALESVIPIETLS